MFRSLKVGLGMFALIATFALLAATTDGAATPRKAAKSKVKPAATQSVNIGDYFFDPKNKQVNGGDSVTWTNNGGEAHTVTADDGSFDYVVQPGGTSPSVTPPKTFSYHCRFHPDVMKGTITVGNAPQAKTAKKPAKKPAKKVPAKKPKDKTKG